MEGMSTHGWGRFVTTAIIKSVIGRGRINASRKHNKDLAAAGTPAPRGRPPAWKPKTWAPIPVPQTLESQLPVVQALPEGDIKRSFNKGMTKRRHVRSVPRERETSTDVIMKSSCQLQPC